MSAGPGPPLVLAEHPASMIYGDAAGVSPGEDE
jgi:hypothetical protein